jgi:hypothetical protein
MKYIISWTVPQATFNAAVARFLETGGAPPKGVTMLGRWHGMNGQGFAISESTDAKAMYQWVAEWSDVLSLTVTPCVEDADAGAVMATLGERWTWNPHSHRYSGFGSGGTSHCGDRLKDLCLWEVDCRFELIINLKQDC